MPECESCSKFCGSSTPLKGYYHAPSGVQLLMCDGVCPWCNEKIVEDTTQHSETKLAVLKHIKKCSSNPIKL